MSLALSKKLSTKQLSTSTGNNRIMAFHKLQGTDTIKTEVLNIVLKEDDEHTSRANCPPIKANIEKSHSF